MRAGPWVASIVAVAAIACGLAGSGVTEDTSAPDDAAPPPGDVVDASAGAGDDGAGSSDSPLDAGDAAKADAAPDACPTTPTKEAFANTSITKKTIDGLLGDWRPPDCDTIVLTQTTADFVHVPTAGAQELAVARVRLEWEPAALYVAIEVTSTSFAMQATDSGCICENSSAEIYVSGRADLRTGDYLSTDHHYIVDSAGDAFEFVELGPAQWIPAGDMAYAVHRDPSNTAYTVEARIDAAKALGAPLSSASPLAFDLQVNDGANQSRLMIWARAPHGPCTCDAGCSCNAGPNGDFPAFDTLVFAPLHLR